jgi:Fic family protein
LELTFSSELAQEISRAEAEILRLNDDPPRTRLLEAVARQLLRAEAVASSRIEGYELSHRRLAEAAFAPADAGGTARSVYANVRAMEEATRLATERRPFDVDDIRAIHRRLFEGTRDERFAGVLRDTQNWIGGGDYSAYGAEFIPVPETAVLPLLKDLCVFLERDDLPVVVQAGLAHAQFETIHPFLDGNGRVGRCLVHVVLRRRRLAPHYVPPISVALAANADRYIDGLTAYRGERFEDWLTMFVRATYAAARRAEDLGHQIDRLQAKWRQQATNPRAGSAADKLISELPVQPVVDVRTAAKMLGVSDEAARQAIERLTKSGVLEEVTGRLRGRSWECVGLFALLDDFDRDVATPAGASSWLRAPRRTRQAARA